MPIKPENSGKNREIPENSGKQEMPQNQKMSENSGKPGDLGKCGQS